MSDLNELIALVLFFLVIYLIECCMVWYLEQQGVLPVKDEDHVDGRN